MKRFSNYPTFVVDLIANMDLWYIIHIKILWKHSFSLQEFVQVQLILTEIIYGKPLLMNLIGSDQRKNMAILLNLILKLKCKMCLSYKVLLKPYEEKFVKIILHYAIKRLICQMSHNWNSNYTCMLCIASPDFSKN